MLSLSTLGRDWVVRLWCAKFYKFIILLRTSSYLIWLQWLPRHRLSLSKTFQNSNPSWVLPEYILPHGVGTQYGQKLGQGGLGCLSRKISTGGNVPGVEPNTGIHTGPIQRYNNAYAEEGKHSDCLGFLTLSDFETQTQSQSILSTYYSVQRKSSMISGFCQANLKT